ncbi:MAG: SGNH/GDSL hydrolase family protein [Treponema sp.]|nr:SGNH/GDSL hydrolase family protein [Treponema sp.]
MNSFSNEVKNYKAMNHLAAKGAVVLFGGNSDKNIPVLEIAESCELNFKIYNRSFSRLSVSDAADYFDECIQPLEPESVLLHIGASDVESFRANPGLFDQTYLALISHIKQVNKKIRIAVLSIANPGKSEVIADMNRHLNAIAASERCDFYDTSRVKVWNPEAIRQMNSFLYTQGFVEPLKIKKPLRDVAGLIYSYASAMQESVDEEYERMPQVG